MVHSDDFQNRIAFTGKVDFVTFYLVKDPLLDDAYDIYTESGQIELGRHNILRSPLPYDQAMQELRKAMQRLEKTLEKKRSGMPTAYQLYFLFRQKIPIPLTLTWSEASDLIKERLQQIEDEKQALLDHFDGFAVNQIVEYRFNNQVKAGKITKLYEIQGKKYADVRLYTRSTLQEIELSMLRIIPTHNSEYVIF